MFVGIGQLIEIHSEMTQDVKLVLEQLTEALLTVATSLELCKDTTVHSG